jgi:hypothetical protein
MLNLLISLSLAAPSLQPLQSPVQPLPALEQAEKALQELKFTEANQALEQARRSPNLSHENLLHVLELTGEVNAQLGQRQVALDAFKQLLYLDPNHRLGNQWGPKIRTVFFDARDVVVALPPLSFERCEPAPSTGSLHQLCLHVSPDALRIFSAVRVHLLQTDKPTMELKTALTGETSPGAGSKQLIEVPPANELRWWADLLGSRDEILTSLGDAEHPQIEKAAATPTASLSTGTNTQTGAGLKATPTSTHTPAAGGLETKTNPGGSDDEPRYRPVAYGLGIAGALALIGGGVFAYELQQERNTFDHAQRDSSGNITGISQRDAFALGARASNDATAANILFSAGGVLAAGGVGVFIAGSL